LPICPHCGRKIDHLLREYVATVREQDVAKLNDYGELEYWEVIDRDYLDAETLGFRCPSCGETITESAETAIEFLRGDLETQLKLIGEARRGRRDG